MNGFRNQYWERKEALKETQEHNTSCLPGRKISSRKGNHIIMMIKGTMLEWLSADSSIKISLNHFFSQNYERAVSSTRIMCLPSFFCAVYYQAFAEKGSDSFFLEDSTCQSSTWRFPWPIIQEVCTLAEKWCSQSGNTPGLAEIYKAFPLYTCSQMTDLCNIWYRLLRARNSCWELKLDPLWQHGDEAASSSCLIIVQGFVVARWDHSKEST